MVPTSLLYLWWLTLVGVIVSTEGWLWIASNGQQRKAGVEVGKMAPVQHGPPQYSYRPEGSHWSPQYTYEGPPVPPVTVALPFAVPFTAQMAGMGGGMKNVAPQPVQLVPCLCPITREEGQLVQQQTQQQQQPQQQQQQPQQQPYVQQQPQQVQQAVSQ